MAKSGDFKVSREEQETVIVAEFDAVTVYSTNPSHWRALKRRAVKLGGKVEQVHRLGKREMGGCIIFPGSAFSLARFGLRASPKKEVQG